MAKVSQNPKWLRNQRAQNKPKHPRKVECPLCGKMLSWGDRNRHAKDKHSQSWQGIIKHKKPGRVKVYKDY